MANLNYYFQTMNELKHIKLYEGFESSQDAAQNWLEQLVMDAFPGYSYHPVEQEGSFNLDNDTGAEDEKVVFAEIKFPPPRYKEEDEAISADYDKYVEDIGGDGKYEIEVTTIPNDNTVVVTATYYD